MKSSYKLVFLVVMIILALIIVKSLYAQDYHTFTNEEIDMVGRDYYEGQMIVTAGDAVYIIEASTGSVVEEYQLPYRTWIAQVGIPDYERIYGIHSSGSGTWTSEVYCVDRSNGYISNSILPQHYHPKAIVQTETRIYVILSGDAHGVVKQGEGLVSVFNKADLSLIEQWPCEDYPSTGIYNEYTNLIYTPREQYTIPYSIEMGSRYTTDSYFRIGVFAPDNGGEKIAAFKVGGYVTDMVVTNDGNVVVGMEGSIDWHTLTLSILGDPITDILITDTDMKSLDIDIATNRVFGATSDYSTGETSKNGRILVWDYDTGEYEFIESGIQGLDDVTYCDGKLYGITGEDNRLYYIDIE